MTNVIRGAGGGGKGGKQRSPIEAPDSLRSISYAQILDLVGEGEIEGFVHPDAPLRDVYLNETPVENADATLNFKNILMDYRLGTPTQDYIKGFEQVQNEIAVGVELRQGTPWTRNITNLNLSAVRVRISVPSLTKADTSNGDVNGYKIDYRIELAVDGGAFGNPLNASFSGKTSTKYERVHELALPPATSNWTIRVTRITPNADSVTTGDITIIESFAEIIEVKLRMPMSALVGITVDAEQFNAIPSRAYHMKGRIIKVPTNYDPVERTYAGIWDGTFQNRYSNNPAWVFYDMALNKRYGLGHKISAANVDKWALYEIAQYCDELVPDGRGGMEPRFTCNIVLQAREDATRVMMNLATIFRGIVYATGTSITAVGDMPQDAVYTYSPANVIDGTFDYTSSARGVRFTTALVSWNDLNDFGRAKNAYYENEEGIARYGIQPTEVIAMGCTSEGQAYRMAKYIVLTSLLETNAVSFSVGLDGTLVAPGKIVKIADPLRAGQRRGGRLSSATSTSATLDAPIVGVVVGDTITLTMPDGTIVERAITSITGNVVGFAATPAVAQAESMWMIESPSLAAQRFRIIGVMESSESPDVFNISAIQHAPEKFAEVELGVKLDPQPISSGVLKVLPSPEDVTLTWRDISEQNATQQIITIEWTPVIGASSYIVRYRVENGSWVELGNVIANSTEFVAPKSGEYIVSVTAMTSAGVQSTPTFSGPHIVAPNAAAPGFLATLESDIADALAEAENAAAIADGKITSFWQASPPSIGPSTGQAQNGDLWFDTDDGNRIYRVVGGVWTDAQDDELALALANASTAQATADGKVQTFFQSTTPTATAIGDLWFNTTTEKLTRWNGTAWSQTLIDLAAISADINAALAVALDAQDTADGKIDSFYQPSPPSVASEGDIWFDTDDGNKIYTRRSGAWVATQDSAIAAALASASTAQATADGRVRTFFQSATPTATAIGDLWFQTDARVLFRWNGSAWTTFSEADVARSSDGMVPNPDFEASGTIIPPPGWIVNGSGVTLSYVTSGQQSGTRSLKIAATAANAGIMSATPIAVKPGQVLELTAFSRLVTAWPRMRLRYETAAGAFLSARDLDNSVSGWRENTLRDTVPANAAKVRIALGLAFAGDADFDAITFRRLDASETAPNLLSNADFTYGTTGWQGGPVRYLDYSEANQLRTGSLGSGVYSFIFQDVELGLVIGGGIDVTAQVEVAPVGWSGAALVQISVEFLNASKVSVGGTIVASRIVGQIPDGQFTRISVSGKTPATAYNFLRVVLTSLGPVSALVAWRRPKLERSPVPTFFDPGVDRTFGNELLVVGSGRRVGDQRNLQPLTIGGIRSRWDGLLIGYSASADEGPATITINVSAATLRAGSAAIPYNASSFVTSQVRGTTVRRQLYYLDPTYSGGAKTLNMSTNANSLADRDDVVWVGEVTTVSPASGGGGGGGDPGAGCVDAIMWVNDYQQARDVQLGELLDCPVYGDQATIEQRHVRQNHSTLQPCHVIRTESGAEVVASDSTPMTLRDGSVAYMPEMMGREALVETDGVLAWENVVLCEPVGLRPVIAFNVGDTCYFAGRDPRKRIATHNILIKP